MRLHEEAPQLRPYNDDLASTIYNVPSARHESLILSIVWSVLTAEVLSLQDIVLDDIYSRLGFGWSIFVWNAEPPTEYRHLIITGRCPLYICMDRQDVRYALSTQKPV